ncbi:MAG TPA: urate oxidase [Thermoanaerobaculia bacterium]|nr:urate oxidase [Thermoanaerobaculia bacterium]
MPALHAHRYGKNRVLVGVLDRAASPHRYLELAVDVALEGDFGETYTRGDNTRVVPTDTLKNTVYWIAGREPFATIEELALLLARHLVATYPQVDRAEVVVEQRGWRPIAIEGEERIDAFERAGEERATACATVEADGRARLTAGLRGLELLKTAHSGFRDFFRDARTTLQDTDDRLFVTVVEATWLYAVAGEESARPDWEAARGIVRGALLRAFADHESLSVQQTLYAMAEAALDASPLVQEVHLVLPNRHHLLADLSRFGLDNSNVVFVPTSEPFGRIEATGGRDSGGGE